ncbi:MAG: hypothetical protein CL833_04890 [Crocinitomicaceae bacterium]|nr:hypothetical protein [Crocinitomicaceae bacterium]|tara:strand:+ start:265 stop:696 length:432 start_codon:yes stop_codon:yes gene_type:complete
MKKVVLSLCLLFVLGSYSDAQDMKLRIVKPLPLVRNTLCHTAQVTGKMLGGVKDVLKAPFTTPLPRLEVKTYKLTWPRLKWERGKLEEVKPSDNVYETKAQWRERLRLESLRLKKASPDILAPKPMESELLDMPRVPKNVTFI